MKALILAAGYATRLYPLTKEYPKPLLPVAQRPIADYIAEKIYKTKKIKEIIVITNERFYKNFVLWSSDISKNIDMPIKVLRDGTKTEKDRLGAIGDINFALTEASVNEDVLVVAGDNLFEDDLSGFLEFALSKSPQITIGVYDIKEKEKASKYGVIKLDGKSKITDFAEKPQNPQSSLVATCLYYIPALALSFFRDYLKDSSNEHDAAGSFIGWLSKREAVFGFVFSKRWYDIGDPGSYQEADKVFGVSK